MVRRKQAPCGNIFQSRLIYLTIAPPQIKNNMTHVSTSAKKDESEWSLGTCFV